MTAYYNEIDPFAAEWLRELIKAGHIAPGIVDTRSIEDVEPADLHGFTQCHFFAGIGVWSYALRQAKWPDSRSVWTGSCPCQPFSAAGKRTGTADLRHLWPSWFHLIESCRPEIVFGEQVEAAIKHGWLDLVSADLEGADYAVGAADTCAAGFGAPHIRSRLYFVADTAGDSTSERRLQCVAGQLADTERSGWRGRRAGEASSESGEVERPERLCATGELGDTAEARWEIGRSERSECAETRIALPETRSQDGELGHAEHAGHDRPPIGATEPGSDGQERRLSDGAGAAYELGDTEINRREGQSLRADRDTPNGITETGLLNGFWRDAQWLWCRDGKYRPVEPGTFPLAHGAANRVGRLRGYGNAIVAPVAQAFIEAYLNATS